MPGWNANIFTLLPRSVIGAQLGELWLQCPSGARQPQVAVIPGRLE
jgi:hypothetical protein